MTTQPPLTDSPTLAQLTVEEAMRPGLITCPRVATLPEIAAVMIGYGTHSVLVARREPGTPSIVTDFDLVRAALHDPDATAAALAHEPVDTVPAGTSLAGALEQMAVRYVPHLLVGDPPTGMISSLDLAAVVGGHRPHLARMLRPAPARPSPSARTLSAARIGDAMHAGVVSCTPDTALHRVARTLADHRVHSVAVAGIDSASDFAWSLVSDLDLIVALHRDGPESTAGMIAVGPPVAVQEDASLDAVAALMLERDARHVLAVDRHGRPSGVVSTLDVARIVAAG